MASESNKPTPQLLLRAQEIRELIRDAHGAFAPDYVARALRHRYMEPYEEDAEEIAGLLGELIDTARARIVENGIEPLHDDAGRPPRLTKRERESVAHLAMLMGTRSAALLFSGRREEALAEAHEAIAWGRTSQDHERLALCWIGLYAVNERMGQWDNQRDTIGRALEEARASGIPKLIIDAMLPMISYLIESVNLEEAERLNLEAQSILLNDAPEEDRHPGYAVSLSHAARIARYRGNYSESIRGFREALRWADGTLYPLVRCSLLSHLGSLYAHLEQQRQCIECQQELLQLGDAIGVDKIKSWACLNLADSHLRLKEYDRAMELLDYAERYATAGSWDHISLITMYRAEVLIALERPEEAAVLCRQIVDSKHETIRASRRYNAMQMLGEIDEKSSRYESAEEHYRRAVAFAMEEFSQRASHAQVKLVRTLSMLKRYDEAMTLLDGVSFNGTIPPSQEAQILRLRAMICEARGDLRSVIDFERKAVAIEQEILEQKAEQSLRNARIMAETDLLEREAELERERRRRLERELANAIVALDDRTRQAAVVEERLRQVLAASTDSSERAATMALQEALHSLRPKKRSKEQVHHYLSKVDEDFQRRLRQRFPNLTRKQERLCGLIRAGLDSKEIGSLLGLEPEGLKALRKRLRKTLGLDQEVSLETFLADI